MEQLFHLSVLWAPAPMVFKSCDEAFELAP